MFAGICSQEMDQVRIIRNTCIYINLLSDNMEVF